MSQVNIKQRGRKRNSAIREAHCKAIAFPVVDQIPHTALEYYNNYDKYTKKI